MHTHRYRLRAIVLVGVRGFTATITSMGFYLVTTVGCVAAALIIHSYLGGIAESGLSIFANLLFFPLHVAVVISVLYLGITASVAISREKDVGTLEVLFYGPVDSLSYVLAKFLEQFLIFAVMMLFYALVFWVFGTSTKLGLTLPMVLSMFLALAPVASVIAFGLLLSVLTNRVRTSILVLVLVLLVFLGVPLGNSFLAGIDGRHLSPALLYAQMFLSWAAHLIQHVSPFAYLQQGMQAITMWDYAGYLTNFLPPLLFTVALLLLATVTLEKKGVLKR